ncbi:MAG: ABC transporter permease [Chloroflexi bacterium]|nr:ABC transporter permease [Chloroflexota bacterium]
MAFRRFWRHKAAVLGLTILVIISIGAIFADVIAIEPEETFYSFDELQTKKWLPPLTDGHLMGTDDIGRDVFSRVVRGSRVSLRVGFFAIGIAGIAGTLIGLAAGYFGGWVDQVISRIIDLMLAFPDLLLAIAILAALGPSLVNAMVALGLAGIPGYARVVRGATLAARELVYVRAARAVGMSDTRIMLRHILPNVLSPILIMMTLGLGGAILAASALGFLGLAADPPTPEWGSELNLSRAYLRTAWWVSTFNGAAIAVTVLSVNMVGDGLREALDPQASSWAR